MKVKTEEVALHLFGFFKLGLGMAIPTAPIWGFVPPQMETRISDPTLWTRPLILSRPFEIRIENFLIESNFMNPLAFCQ
jgi:hypothetical protein